MKKRKNITLNYFRGNQPFQRMRHKVMRSLFDSSILLNDNVNNYLAKSVFKIRPDEWLALSFDDNDWQSMDSIHYSNNSALHKNLLWLVEHHILQNLNNISDMIGLTEKISSSLFTTDTLSLDLSDIIDAFSVVDRQSLHYWRIFSALNIHNGEQLPRGVHSMFRTSWLKRHFYNPFMFYNFNLPAEDRISYNMDYVVSGNEHTQERHLIEYCVGDRWHLENDTMPLIYASLMMHPYDALNMLIEIVDIFYCSNQTIPRGITRLLKKINQHVDHHPLDAAINRCNGVKIEYTENLYPEQIRVSMDIGRKKYLASLFSSDPFHIPSSDSVATRMLSAMRAGQYPEFSDWEMVHKNGNLWRFLDYGKFLLSFANCFFMYPRREWKREKMDVLFLSDFFGKANAIIAQSPGLATAPERNQIVSNGWSKIVQHLDLIQTDVSPRNDRTWINWLQYEQSQDQNSGRVLRWVDRLYARSKITRHYISGADWSWLDNILSIQKITPFRGKLSASYVFVMRGVETGDPEHGIVRSILRPIYQKYEY